MCKNITVSYGQGVDSLKVLATYDVISVYSLSIEGVVQTLIGNLETS